MDEDKLRSKVVKIKRLQHVSRGYGLLLPKTWIDSLDITRETNLMVAYHPDERKIVISVADEKETLDDPALEFAQTKNGKEISDPESE